MAVQSRTDDPSKPSPIGQLIEPPSTFEEPPDTLLSDKFTPPYEYEQPYNLSITYFGNWIISGQNCVLLFTNIFSFPLFDGSGYRLVCSPKFCWFIHLCRKLPFTSHSSIHSLHSWGLPYLYIADPAVYPTWLRMVPIVGKYPCCWLRMVPIVGKCNPFINREILRYAGTASRNFGSLNLTHPPLQSWAEFLT